MADKLKSLLFETISAVLLAGIIILVIGLYYLVVKSGIPYQDPTLDMVIQYEINYGIGDLLSKVGFILTLFGGVGRLIIWRVRK